MPTVAESPVLIPGAYMPESDGLLQRTRTQYASSIFLPPTDDTPQSATPTSNSFLSQSISTSLHATSHENGRKRPRLDTVCSHNHRVLRGHSYTSTPASGGDALSPPPFVNTNYRLAGGLDAQSALIVQREDDVHEYDYEVDCRPSRFTRQSIQETASDFPHTPGTNDVGRAKRKQSSGSPKGWGKTVWALTGGIAGKVIDFCWNTTFKGFYAGGGNGYRFDIGTPDVAASTWTGVSPREDVFHADYPVRSSRQGRAHTPVPGGFPEDSTFTEDYVSKPLRPRMDDLLSTPTAMTRQPVSSISRDSWVMVDGLGESVSREGSPARKKSRASTANLYGRPTLPRHASSSGRPRMVSRSSTHKSSASFASPRTFSAVNLNTNTSSSQPRLSVSNGDTDFQIQAHTPPNAKRPTSRASLASPRRYASQPASSAPVSQPSPEVRKFEQKLRRKAAKQDETMNRFNAQLEAMIREGQQALGSKIEVEVVDSTDLDLDVDEGFGRGEGDGQGKSLETWERDYVRPGLWA